MEKNNKIISFEGIDGSGKSTILSEVANKLRADGYSVLVLQEPGYTELGLEIRKILKSSIKKSKSAELLLFLASRADLVENVIEPSRKEYDYILLDRYIDSTRAYQGYGNGHSLEFIELIMKEILHNQYPDKTYFIDVDLDIAEKRRRLRHEEIDKFDNDEEFAKRVYDGYKKIAKSNHYMIVNNNTPDIKNTVDIIYNDISKNKI